MAFELILLGALIFIFIVSFCGLLQKIKQTYDRERLLAERIARRRENERRRRSADSFTEIYINPAFSNATSGGVFPAAPPPYSLYCSEEPPKYDEVVKVDQSDIPSEETERSRETLPDTGPPPYTINLTLVTETINRPQ